MTTVPRRPPAEGPVPFVPGDEFVLVGTPDLLARLRLDPSVSVLNLMQEPLTVWIDGDEVDVDPDTAIGPAEPMFAADDGQSFGYFIERCGDWLHEWASDTADAYVKIKPGIPLKEQISDIIFSSGLDTIFDEGTEQTWTLPE